MCLALLPLPFSTNVADANRRKSSVITPLGNAQNDSLGVKTLGNGVDMARGSNVTLVFSKTTKDVLLPRDDTMCFDLPGANAIVDVDVGVGVDESEREGEFHGQEHVEVFE